MLSDETLEQYRRMTPGERLELTLEMMRDAMVAFLEARPEMVQRRFELVQRENDARNEFMLRAISGARRHS
jgi:hypothetical protein